MDRGSRSIFGVTLENNLEEGRQDVLDGQALSYGMRITDPCINREDTESVLQELATAARPRRGEQQPTTRP